MKQEIELPAELAARLHERIITDGICDDVNYAMAFSAAFVQELVEEGWRFSRE